MHGNFDVIRQLIDNATYKDCKLYISLQAIKYNFLVLFEQYFLYEYIHASKPLVRLQFPQVISTTHLYVFVHRTIFLWLIDFGKKITFMLKHFFTDLIPAK